MYVDVLDNEISTDNIFNLKSAKLIYVNGKGALSISHDTVSDTYWGTTTISDIKLNDIPLIQINAPGCPTSESIVATGYGIEKAQCKELEDISDRINSDFVSLDKSIDDLKPLLLLLESGLYMIADAICYPTDGDGNFFWNVADEPTACRATACGYLSETFQCVTGNPIYLYPTQSADCYNSERVKYYTDLFTDNDNPPRAIVYNFGEFINFIIDGHHKACAAAVAGKPVKCIMIIPCSGKSYDYDTKKLTNMWFGKIDIPASQIPKKYRPEFVNQSFVVNHNKMMLTGRICHREWEDEYLKSVQKYPSFEEYVNMTCCDLTPDMITDEFINNAIDILDTKAQQDLKSALCILKFTSNEKLKNAAMICGKISQNCSVKKLAFKFLLDMKGDKEVEQFFIDYIVNSEDCYDPLLNIANSFWD